jgi:carboxypeptidase Taq
VKPELERLKALLAEIDDLRRAAAVLEWDQLTYMPAAGAEERGAQLGTLGRIAHDRATSVELGRLIESLGASAQSLHPDSDDARLISVAARDFQKATRVPSAHVEEFAQVTTMAYHAWVEARRGSRFAGFAPHLERVLDLLRRYVGFFPTPEHPYDVLLDAYEPGMRTSEVKAIFDALRPKQVALIKQIAAAEPVDDSFLHQDFDAKRQWDLGVEVTSQFGYDWKRGRQDLSEHPFSTAFSGNDVRITTRVDTGFLGQMIFSTMHECGHALYDQGIPASLARTPLAEGASNALHESQSRLWENLVGRSLPFWQRFYPRLQESFPQLASVPLQKFYRGVNRVQPSLIRTEADEATYNLHVMLRLELEIDVLEGRIEVRDLPGAWNERMHDYLGVVPADDTQGLLQDVHWSSGLFGYFPTYALGNLVSAQLWERIEQEIPDLSGKIAEGSFGPLLAWLRENVHRHGKKFPPQELVKRVTGSTIEAGPYLRYLEKKFGRIYGL